LPSYSLPHDLLGAARRQFNVPQGSAQIPGGLSCVDPRAEPGEYQCCRNFMKLPDKDSNLDYLLQSQA
jgi:hypothetical protein